VEEIGIEITCGGVSVAHGDLVLADHDGVVVVPYDRADEVLTLAEEKMSTENVVRNMLLHGTSVRDAFAAHRVL
jgi:4-hydroxy-4-methyl-2-oxoglutarate aldolase